jgi:hypothetical protein
MEILTEIAAAIGVFLGVLNSILICRKWYRDRQNLKVDVDWEWTEMDPHDCSSPRIGILNRSERTMYLDKIEIVGTNGELYLIGEFDNREIKSEQRFVYRPDWSDPSDDEPRFSHDWEGMRISVSNSRGQSWKSKTVKTKPSWFRVRPETSWDLP